MKNKAHQGFTLIEVLVAMLIMASLSALLIINIMPNDGDRVNAEAQKLQVVLRACSDYARLSGRRLSWLPRAEGYTFEVLNKDNEWVAFEPKSDSFTLLSPYSFRGKVVMTALMINKTALLKDRWRLVFDPSGMNLPYTVVLDSANALSDAVNQNAGLKSYAKYLIGDPLGHVVLSNTDDPNASSPSQR